jgi:hypothetical protein
LLQVLFHKLELGIGWAKLLILCLGLGQVGQEVGLLSLEKFDAVRICPCQGNDIFGQLKSLESGPNLLEFPVCTCHCFLAEVTVSGGVDGRAVAVTARSIQVRKAILGSHRGGWLRLAWGGSACGLLVGASFALTLAAAPTAAAVREGGTPRGLAAVALPPVPQVAVVLALRTPPSAVRILRPTAATTTMLLARAHISRTVAALGRIPATAHGNPSEQGAKQKPNREVRFEQPVLRLEPKWLRSFIAILWAA